MAVMTATGVSEIHAKFLLVVWLCGISSTFASSASSDPAGRPRDLGTHHFGATATFNSWNFHQFKSTMFKLTATVGILALAVSGGTFHLNCHSGQSYPSRANLPY